MKFAQLLSQFKTEADCKAYLTKRRWPDGVHCPRCGNLKVWALKARPFNWLCKACNKSGKGEGTCGIGSGKKPVVGAISRAGKVVARVVDSVDGATLKAFVRETVSEQVSLLVTDQHGGYRGLSPSYPHAVIDHAKGQ